MKQYAVTDLGTNSARLMIAHINKNSVEADYKTLRYIRIGEKISDNIISKAAMRRAAAAVNEFKKISADYNVGDRFYCLATSAVRDAKNSVHFCEYILKECAIQVDVISGDKEALIGFAGCVEGYGAMVDIGGGSTEVMVGSISKITYAKSYDIGTVRFHQLFPGGDLADSNAFSAAHRFAAKTFAKVPAANGFTYTAIGGTATALAAIDLGIDKYDAKLIDNHILSSQKVKQLCAVLESKTKRQRMQLAGLEDKKADVIVFGAILLSEFMQAARANCVKVSTRDNLEGYLNLI